MKNSIANKSTFNGNVVNTMDGSRSLYWTNINLDHKIDEIAIHNNYVSINV